MHSPVAARSQGSTQITEQHAKHAGTTGTDVSCLPKTDVWLKHNEVLDLRSLLVLMDLVGFALALIGASRAWFPLWRLACRQCENREKRARLDRMFEAEINQVNPHAADDPMQLRSGSSAQQAEIRRRVANFLGGSLPGGAVAGHLKVRKSTLSTVGINHVDCEGLHNAHFTMHLGNPIPTAHGRFRLNQFGGAAWARVEEKLHYCLQKSC